MRNIIKLTILCSLFIGCGFFENDGNLFEEIIVGNFKIQQLKNDTQVLLSISDTPETSIIIIENCKLVMYDSINKKIFAEDIINADILNYYEIIILNPKEFANLKAYKKKKITKKKFDKAISNCKNCVIKYPRSAKNK